MYTPDLADRCLDNSRGLNIAYDLVLKVLSDANGSL